MKILSINLGINGGIAFMENGKILKHTSFHKINVGTSIGKLSSDTLTNFLGGTEIRVDELDYIVFAGYDKDMIGLPHFDFVVDPEFRLTPLSAFQEHGKERKTVFHLPSLLPPYTDRPYNYVTGYVIYNQLVVPSLIVSPDMCHSSIGYFTSEFVNSINITVSYNDYTIYDGSSVSVSESNEMTVVNRPKISVGKLYPKMTELLGFGSGYFNHTTISDISPRFNDEEYNGVIDEGVNNHLSDIRDNYELTLFNEVTKHKVIQKLDKFRMLPYYSYDEESFGNKFVLKMASICQKVIENTVIDLITNSIKNYSPNFTRNITLSGETFLNRRLNTKILNKFKDYNIHISPLTESQSMSLGGALYVNSLYGTRRRYHRDFLLSNSHYINDMINNGPEINYEELSDVLDGNMISFHYKSPECTKKSMGHTGFIFDVSNDEYSKRKDKLCKELFSKPCVVVLEESYGKHFIVDEYTFNNNTISKPNLPHLFKDFIHDDGYVNIFVINEVTNPSLFNIIKKTGREYIGLCDYNTDKFRSIYHNDTLFTLSSDVEVKFIIIDDKLHKIEE